MKNQLVDSSHFSPADWRKLSDYIEILMAIDQKKKAVEDEFLHREPQALKNHMAQNKLLPSGEIIIDSHRHTYSIMSGGQTRQASYIATLNAFEQSEPRLICSYGFVDGNKQFTYSSINKRVI